MERLNRLKEERRVTSALAVLSVHANLGAVVRIDFDWLPMATPLDPAEEPPGSIDPLGTLAHAERLADALLPGFTARMWRGPASHVRDRCCRYRGSHRGADEMAAKTCGLRLG